MSILETKSQISDCENIRQNYQNIDRKLAWKKDDLVNVNNDWQEATSRKLSATSDVQRALFTGAQNALIRQKQRLEAEIRDLDSKRNEIHNDYNLTGCPNVSGSIW